MGEDKNRESDVTIVVSSCDLYKDAWMPFLKLLQIFWRECDYPILLVTEEQDYKCDFMDVKTVKAGKDKSWTGRLRYALEQVQTQFVLFFLEDFFLQRTVDSKGFEKALNIFKERKDVGMIHFTPVEKNTSIVTPGNIENSFYELPVRRRTLRTRVAVTLFRKEYFLRLLYEDETPWQYERESHIRSMFAGYKIIRQDYRCCPPVFYYTIDYNLGIGITARKWLSETKKLFETCGIMDVNYDALGVLSVQEINEKKQTRNARIKDLGLREWIYAKITHPLKRKLRHKWFIQDVLNMKKYIKYWNYYRKMK